MLTPQEIKALLQKTTISYPTWVRNVNLGRYTPKDGSATYWGKALAGLDVTTASKAGIATNNNGIWTRQFENGTVTVDTVNGI